MYTKPDLLILVNDTEHKARILNEFKKQKFRIDIDVVTDGEQAFKLLEFDPQKKVFGKIPEIIIIDGNIIADDLLDTIKSDLKFSNVSLYVLVDPISPEFEKIRFSKYRIAGYVDRNFVFNDYTSSHYLDLVDLHIRILKIGLHQQHSQNYLE